MRPSGWAQAQHDSAIAPTLIGNRELRTARLTEALGVFHAALEVRTRERAPLDWAQTQTELAGAFASLGECQAGTRH